MPPPIIQRRLEKAIAVKLASSFYHRKRYRESKPGALRRGTYKNGVRLYVKGLSLYLTPKQLEDLDALSKRLCISKGAIARDALEMYLWLAEQERVEALHEENPDNFHPKKRRAKPSESEAP